MATLHIEAQLSSDDLLKAMEKLEKISQGLPAALTSRYHELIDKRRAGTIGADEYEELLRLTDEVETLHAQRIENLADLALLRGVPLAGVMQQLGIQTPSKV
jgi:hypothetical protein